MAWEIRRGPERYRYHDRRELVPRELSFIKENVLTVSKIAATVAITKDLLFLVINNTPTLPWESLFPYFLSCDLDLLILPISPKMNYDWLQPIPIFRTPSQSEWLAQWWAETHAETMGGKEVFAGTFEEKKYIFSVFEVLLCGCDVWNGLQSWGVERWISGSEEPKDKVKTWKAKQGHGKKPGSGWVTSGTGLSLTYGQHSLQDFQLHESRVLHYV